ncbi:hypothetical protein BGZ88_001000 [Linnemannia elongata]|nr:hypothetical protein BGZ88_001000 [Linnemannia elongata]
MDSQAAKRHRWGQPTKRLRSSKRKGRGPQCKVHSNNDDEEEEGYSSDGTASLAATQKNVWSAYSNDGEDKDDRVASTMTLADLRRRGCEIAYLLDRAHASNSNTDVETGLDWKAPLDRDKTPTDDTNGNHTLNTRGCNSSCNSGKKNIGGSQLIDMGTYEDYSTGGVYSELEFRMAMKNGNKARKGLSSSPPRSFLSSLSSPPSLSPLSPFSFEPPPWSPESLSSALSPSPPSPLSPFWFEATIIAALVVTALFFRSTWTCIRSAVLGTVITRPTLARITGFCTACAIVVARTIVIPTGNTAAKTSTDTTTNAATNARGDDLDYAEAMTWYQKAAEQGHATAQYNIGSLYHQGLGMSQDYAEAMTWFRKAAEQGDATAQYYYIGIMYEIGLGVTKDTSKALGWYKTAAEQGDSDAENAVDKLERKGYNVNAKDMSLIPIRAREEDSDGDEDSGDKRSVSTTTMALANFDAGDLDTPAYSTAQTLGTAIGMFNGVALALYHISGMATFEEDLEHVNGNSIMEFIDRMDKRAACETDSEDEDEANQGAVDLTVHKFDSYNDTHSGQDLGDEDNGARGTYYSDSDQETVCGYGSGEDKDSFGRNHKAADNANDPGHSYEDEDGDHQYEYVDHRNSDNDLEDSDADSQATSDSAGTTSAVKKLD